MKSIVVRTVRARLAISALAMATALTAGTAGAKVEKVVILSRAPYADGKSFAGVGAFETIRGRAWFALDPKLPANARIVDLRLAPRDKRGMVVFSTDFVLTRPVAAIDATLIYDTPNRGAPVSYLFNDAPDPAERVRYLDDGFINRHGFAVLSSAWQWDVTASDDGEERLIFAPPVVRPKGAPVTGMVANEFTVTSPTDIASFVGIAGKDYPAAVADDPRAVLTVRARPQDKRVPIARGQWTFVPARDGAPNSLRMAAGFKPGLIYELSYRARDPLVLGAGLAAIRDLLSWFRTHSFEGAPPAKRVIMLGFSQTGRIIRHMVHDGFDVDERGQLVFDGALAIVAGSGIGSFNHRFAFPTRSSSLVFDRDYPTDLPPFTGRSGPFRDGLFARAADRNGRVPKLFLINNSSEFWNRGASLIATTPDGRQDVIADDSVRAYFAAGLQHYPGSDTTRETTVNCVNPVDRMPTLRALLLRMDDWLRTGRAPPANAYPTIAGRTLVTLDRYQAMFPAGTGLTPPTLVYTPVQLDFGPRFRTQGIIDQQPPRAGSPYGVRVPAPDSNGSDLGGIRSVELRVPLGTYTGWNQRAPQTGFGWMIDRFQGSFQPFARTEAERARLRDSRPSLEARYASREDFVEKTRAAAREVVRDGFLLDEDVERVVGVQAKFYDRVMAHEPADMSCRYLISELVK